MERSTLTVNYPVLADMFFELASRPDPAERMILIERMVAGVAMNPRRSIEERARSSTRLDRLATRGITIRPIGLPRNSYDDEEVRRFQDVFRSKWLHLFRFIARLEIAGIDPASVEIIIDPDATP